jgi:formate hydrogenlyase transcriptional activator
MRSQVSSACFRALAETASDFFFLVREDWGILDLNDQACRTLGYSREDLLGSSLSDIGGGTPGTFSELVGRAKVGDPIVFEGSLHRGDGGILPVEFRGRAVEEEGAMRLVLLARDMSESRRAEVALREREEQLTKVLAAAMDAIVVVDADFSVHLCNPAAHRVFGCSTEELGIGSFDRFLSPSAREAFIDHMLAAAHGGELDRRVDAEAGLTGLRADGREFPFEATLSGTEAGDRQLFLIILRDISDLIRAERQIEKLQMETVYHREVFGLPPGGLIGASAAMQKVFKDIETVAPTDYTVLILGETGTGKELVARALHQASARSHQVLVTVNCAALPPSLVETEFFGHERGAFTGASARKPGRFEMADGGTIFLDEISATSLDVQTKLLRVLQEGEFDRVGGTRTLRVNVRVIAATNQDLQKAVDEGSFRPDLFYRLNVFPLRLPPLRDRKEDIPLLVHHFAARCGPKVGKEVDRVSRGSLDSLMSYDWPGNVRELQNVVERAVILSPGSELVLGDWFGETPDSSGQGAHLTLDDVQRGHIRKVLESTGWRVSGERGAARILGLKPTTLESRMKKLGISRRP